MRQFALCSGGRIQAGGRDDPTVRTGDVCGVLSSTDADGVPEAGVLPAGAGGNRALQPGDPVITQYVDAASRELEGPAGPLVSTSENSLRLGCTTFNPGSLPVSPEFNRRRGVE